MMELTETIHKQKKDNAHMDSILAESYLKTDIFADKLKELFSYIPEDGQIPNSWKLSTTMLIPKEGKNEKILQAVFKMFYRWYLSPSKLSKICNCSNICWKCKQKPGTFYHMWLCFDMAKSYLSMVTNILEKNYWSENKIRPISTLINYC